ncbi:MAG: Hpt domain-containing protein [Desulfobacterales bacterium]|uniref:Hpt domain-containing protein n=1 Tax=Candidatus Desulfaltia bathyphila TaxID=2841697 RepID=A0A8J6N8I2_9BACT|nr:Hpt domain-containing protein [Candidatus Desulfaltia bathyphila]MBL7195897.1 Hpt domain-containing protein [Desulfobacterales bacterium]MBL7207287.1 Hpt domain-containing protein [Desulfobacterales bacterium]
MKEENDKPVFDRDYALEVTDGDTEFLKELADLFNADYPQKLAEISRAIEEKDFKAIDKTAHSLKGASGNLGLTRVYELAFEIEKMGKAENIEGIDKIYQELEKELERFKEFALSLF